MLRGRFICFDHRTCKAGTLSGDRHKKQKAVISTAFLLFNLKSNTMKTQCKYSNYVFITDHRPESSQHIRI